MLILTRKLGESVMIEDTIRITVLEVRGSQVKLGIHAPISVRVNREEVLERQRAEAGLPPLDLPPAEGQGRERANGQRPQPRPEPRSEPRDFSGPRGGQRRSPDVRSDDRRPGDSPARGRELPGDRERERGRGGRGPSGPGSFSRGGRPSAGDPNREPRRGGGDEERWDAPRWESTRREEPRREEPRREEPRRPEPQPRSEPRRDPEARDPWRRDPGRDDPNRDYGRRFKRPPAAERRLSSNPLLGPSEPPEPEEPGTIRRYREPQAMQAFRPRRPQVPNPEAAAEDNDPAANGRLPGSPEPANEAPPRDESDTPPKAQGGAGDFEAA